MMYCIHALRLNILLMSLLAKDKTPLLVPLFQRSVTEARCCFVILWHNIQSMYQVGETSIWQLCSKNLTRGQSTGWERRQRASVSAPRQEGIQLMHPKWCSKSAAESRPQEVHYCESKNIYIKRFAAVTNLLLGFALVCQIIVFHQYESVTTWNDRNL